MATAYLEPSPGLSLAHGARLQNVPSGMIHRDPGLGFRQLFIGDDTEGKPRRNNLVLSIVKSADFYSPVHRHNFEQFRYAIKGDLSIGPQSVIREGELGFTGEGVWYGPQDDGPEPRTVLVLQYAGCSGQGFLNQFTTLKAGQEELKKTGSFQGGKFYPNDGGNPVDGFQALWEWYNGGKKLEYPAPQYDKPISIKPANMAWVPVKGFDGLFRKHLGTFTPREISVRQWKIEPGASLKIDAKDAIQLAFVLSGAGNIAGEMLETESAIRLQPETGTSVLATEEMVLIHWILPTIE